MWLFTGKITGFVSRHNMYFHRILRITRHTQFYSARSSFLYHVCSINIWWKTPLWVLCYFLTIYTGKLALVLKSKYPISGSSRSNVFHATLIQLFGVGRFFYCGLASESPYFFSLASCKLILLTKVSHHPMFFFFSALCESTHLIPLLISQNPWWEVWFHF